MDKNELIVKVFRIYMGRCCWQMKSLVLPVSSYTPVSSDTPASTYTQQSPGWAEKERSYGY